MNVQSISFVVKLNRNVLNNLCCRGGHAATSLSMLRALPGNRLEALKGDRAARNTGTGATKPSFGTVVLSPHENVRVEQRPLVRGAIKGKFADCFDAFAPDDIEQHPAA
jgi:hypothetical protein